MPCTPTPDDLADAHTAVRVAARELVLAIRRRDALLKLSGHRRRHPSMPNRDGGSGRPMPRE